MRWCFVSSSVQVSSIYLTTRGSSVCKAVHPYVADCSRATVDKVDSFLPAATMHFCSWGKGGIHFSGWPFLNSAGAINEWAFLLNCLIVLLGQAGGSEPLLPTGKKKNMHIGTGHGNVGGG